MEIADRIAVVTGAASGIGRASALALAKAGADLVLADLNDARLEEVRGEIAGIGRRALVVHTDVSRLADVEALFEQAVARMGRVDILMNNAGVHVTGPVERIPVADWEWIVGINLWGVIYGVRTVLPHMLARGSGHIVNTASLAGLVGAEPSIPYTVTKFGVVGLSQALAAYLRPKGIGVSVLCPGFVATRITEHERLTPFDDGRDETRRSFFQALADGDWSRMAAAPGGVVTAESVADRVVDAVKANTFLILTHPGHKELVAAAAADPEAAVAQFALFQDMWDRLAEAPPDS